MLAIEDFIADLNDQSVDPAIEPFAGMVCVGRRFLQGRISRDHFARYQVLADAEMLERTLSLRAPEFVGGNIYITKAVDFFASAASHVFDLRSSRFKLLPTAACHRRSKMLVAGQGRPLNFGLLFQDSHANWWAISVQSPKACKVESMVASRNTRATPAASVAVVTSRHLGIARDVTPSRAAPRGIGTSTL